MASNKFMSLRPHPISHIASILVCTYISAIIIIIIIGHLRLLKLRSMLQVFNISDDTVGGFWSYPTRIILIQMIALFCHQSNYIYIII